MRALYIFTAGTSLLSNLKEEKRGSAHHALVEGWLKEVARKKRSDLAVEQALASDPDAQEMAGKMLGYYGVDTAPQTTAELNSFFNLNLTPEDRVVLLSSDTVEGMFCALVTAHLMADPAARQPVTLWKSPGIDSGTLNWNTPAVLALRGEKLRRLARPKAAVMRIPGLDPSTKTGFEGQAIGNLVYTMASLVKYARGASLEPVIVFTGGYKASLPVLTQAAAFLKGIPMMGLREDSDQMVTIPVFSATIDPMIQQGVLGWAWRCRPEVRQQLEAFYEKNDLENWAADTDKRYSTLISDLKPMFAKDGSGLALNILGEALLAVLRADFPEFV